MTRQIATAWDGVALVLVTTGSGARAELFEDGVALPGFMTMKEARDAALERAAGRMKAKYPEVPPEVLRGDAALSWRTEYDAR